MPLPFIHSTTSLFGLAYTGFRGLILGGAWNPSTSITGPRPNPSGVALVQVGDACSTAGVASQVLSTVAGTVPKVNFIYIPQTTGLWSVTGTTADTFYDYAHAGTPANDRFSDYASTKAAYLRRLTFGFAQTGATNAPAVVPKGAEVLLETRLPYLSDAQRRVVLKTTALPSGYPVMDDAEGWGRLNLFAAADGYAVFTGNVVVAMDAAKGGFSAIDRWRNDISGTGKLNKQGTGTLKLGGNNSWSGGTQLEGGRLEGISATAFGKGDVYVSGGTLVSSAQSGLALAGKYTQLATGSLELKLGSGQQGRLNVASQMTVAGGSLKVTFQNGYKPAAGDTLNVIAAASLKGKFDSITVDGFKVTPTYTETGLQLRLDM